MELSEPPQGRCVTEQERVSLLRRAAYAFGGTMASFALVGVVLYTAPEGSLGEKIVGAAFSFAELCAMLYMGASVIDRTKLVDKVASYWERPGDRADSLHGDRLSRRNPDDREDMR